MAPRPAILILGTALALGLSGQSTGIAEFRRAILRSHNDLRARHGVPPLTEDAKLGMYAQDWANHLAATGVFQHSGGDYGENLYYVSSSSPIDAVAAAQEAAASWYAESPRYTYGSGFSAATGHFTQLIWKSSARLGCGMARRPTGSLNAVYVVCSYDPPGNIAGEFPQNVLPPR